MKTKSYNYSLENEKRVLKESDKKWDEINKVGKKKQFVFENCFNCRPSIARPAVNNATWQICADVQFGENGNKDLKSRDL